MSHVPDPYVWHDLGMIVDNDCSGSCIMASQWTIDECDCRCRGEHHGFGRLVDAYTCDGIQTAASVMARDFPNDIGTGKYEEYERRWERKAQKWGTLPEDMPDCCHDHCLKDDSDYTAYFPYRWAGGTAYYVCAQGHRWTCHWGHGYSGVAPMNGLRQKV